MIGARAVRTQLSLNADAAEVLIGAATEESLAVGKPMAIAIVDVGASLLAFLRMDGAPLFCADIAIDKAYTAASFGLPTGKWYPHIKDDESLAHGMPHRPRLVIFGGGVPVRLDGALVGAIGISGGHYSQDERVAAAAIAALETWATPSDGA